MAFAGAGRFSDSLSVNAVHACRAMRSKGSLHYYINEVSVMSCVSHILGHSISYRYLELGNIRRDAVGARLYIFMLSCGAMQQVGFFSGQLNHRRRVFSLLSRTLPFIPCYKLVESNALTAEDVQSASECEIYLPVG